MKTRTTKTLILVVVATLLIGSTSCSLTKGKGIAEAAATQFHNQFNAGQFHEIYDQADEGFRKAASETDFVTLLEAVHRKLGTIGQSNSTGWFVNATPMGTMVTLTYDIEFSEGKGMERLVFHISDDKAQLYNYNINSPLLITR
jgi:hypothetical protein